MAALIDPIALTQRLLGYDTINPPGAEQACAHDLGQLLEDAGFDVTYHEGEATRTNIVAKTPRADAGKALCFTGHLDTVPLGNQPWQVDPFKGEIIDGKLYGRGSTDMKAGVAAFVSAVIETGTAANGPALVLVITAGEETGSEGARFLANQANVLGDAAAMIVAEPTSNYPFVGHKGALWLEAVARGVTAHGSMPEHGVNAVYRAARAVAKLERFEFDRAPHAILGHDTLNVGTIAGGLNINSVPDLCRIGIDIRTTPGAEHEAIRARLATYLGSDIEELGVRIDLPGVWTDPLDPWVQDVYDVMAPLLGERPEPRGANYFTDASELTPYYGHIPTVILGPGEPALAHQTNEYCHVERITQAQAAYKAIIERWPC